MKFRLHLFTLIELLVVIAIISILMSILVPGLNNARLKARQLSCSGNLKQMALLHSSYADSYNDYIAATFTDGPSWPEQLLAQMKSDFNLTEHKKNLRKSILGCQEALSLHVPPAAGWASTYCINVNYGVHNPGAGFSVRRFAQIQHPSLLILNSDSYWDAGGYYWANLGGSGWSAKAQAIHGKWLNALHADGHAGTYIDALLWPSSDTKQRWGY